MKTTIVLILTNLYYRVNNDDPAELNKIIKKDDPKGRAT